MNDGAGKPLLDKLWLDSTLAQAGYEERLAELGSSGAHLIHYHKVRNVVERYPETITLAFPEVRMGGALCYDFDYIFDLFDRLESEADGILLKAIRSLDS